MELVVARYDFPDEGKPHLPYFKQWMVLVIRACGLGNDKKKPR